MSGSVNVTPKKARILKEEDQRLPKKGVRQKDQSAVPCVRIPSQKVQPSGQKSETLYYVINYVITVILIETVTPIGGHFKKGRMGSHCLWYTELLVENYSP